MSNGAYKESNIYTVQWREIVTFEVEVQADNEDEAKDIATDIYCYKDAVDCEYWDGSMQVILEQEGQIDIDPSAAYKESKE